MSREALSMERFLRLLSVYGGREQAWPEAEREPARRLLEENAQARQALVEEREFDAYLDTYEPPLPDLQQQVLKAIPRNLTERFTDWLLPGGGASLLRPVLLGSLPLVIGVLLGSALAVSDSSVSGWEYQERGLVVTLQEDDWNE